MSAFEFLFSFYGLLLGLTMAEVVSGFSRALDAREQRPMGIILPLLTVALIFDIAFQWGAAWRDFREVEFSFRFLVAAVFMTLAYYFSATQLFPREQSKATSLDEHFFSHRRAILGGVLFANVLVFADSMTKQWMLSGSDVVFWSRIGTYGFWFATLITALVAKSRRVVVVALVTNIAFIIFWLLR